MQRDERAAFERAIGGAEAEAVDLLVPAAAPPLELPTRPPPPVDRAVAEHVARLIPDRATIELGLGAIPEAVTGALSGKRGLGIPFGVREGRRCAMRRASKTSLFTDRPTVGRPGLFLHPGHADLLPKPLPKH